MRIIIDEMKAIPLTQGQYCFVDDSDYGDVSSLLWYAARQKHGFYAQTKIGGQVIQMQRYLLGIKDGRKSDHKNHDTLDNRRSNLRIATATENARNRKMASSTFKGVTWHSRLKRWQSYIGSNPKKHIGYFATAVEAAIAYDAHAKKEFGDFACVNFPTTPLELLSDKARDEAIRKCPPRIVLHWRTKISPASQFKDQFYFFSYDGETLTIPQWADKTGINRATLRGRIFAQGWSFEKAITAPTGGIR